MVTRTTARIHLLPAKDAPVVVILRRKPTKVFHIMRWNTETDEIEHGSWFRGKLYPLRCDVSFDGNWMVYLALGGGGNTWNGLCRLPWLKTVCESENLGAWNGGGYWIDEKMLCTNEWSKISRSEKLYFSLTQPDSVSLEFPEEGQRYGDLGVLFPRMERDGWRRSGPFGKRRKLKGAKQYTVLCDGDPGWRYQPTAKHPCLRCFYRGYRQHGYTFEFSLEGYPDLLDPAVEWATWDALGQLVVARSGAVEKYRLTDLPHGQPSFRRSFEDLGPPTGPIEPSREDGWPTFDSQLLRRIAEAFSKRRKAIRHKTRNILCEREVDEQDGEPYERFNVQVTLWEDRPTRIRLSTWEDSVLWLGIQQPAKRGWAFNMDFHGQVQSVAPEDIVTMFEETIVVASERSRSVNAEEEVKELWKVVNPR